MSKIQIGASEHKFCDVSESWIHEHVNERRKDGHPVCAIVTINTDSVNVLLSTPSCSHSQGGYRRPNEKEAEIVKLWQNEHLNEANWTAGCLVDFVKKTHRLVC
jgi:hypothetical protein